MFNAGIRHRANTNDNAACPYCGTEITPMDLFMDEDTGIVSHDGEEARFCPAQFRLLKALIDAYPNVLTKEECFSQASARGRAAQKVVDIQICGIRKRADALGLVITTVWGVGYRLELSNNLHAQVLRSQRLTESRNVRTSLDSGGIAAVRMLKDQGYPATDIARRLRCTYRVVASALDIINSDEERRREKASTAASASTATTALSPAP